MIDPNLKNPLEKLKLYEKELELAKNSRDSSKIFDGLFNLGKFCYEIGAPELSMKYVKEAFALGKNNSSFTNEFKFYKILGDLKLKEGFLKEAQKAYNNSNKNIPKSGDKECQAENYFKLGKVSLLLDKNKQKVSINLFKKSLEIYYTLNIPAEIANVLHQIGLLYLHKINPDSFESFGKSSYIAGPGASYVTSKVIDSVFDAKKKASIKKTLSRSESNFKQALDLLEKSNLKDVQINLVQNITFSLKRIEDLRVRLRKKSKKDQPTK